MKSRFRQFVQLDWDAIAGIIAAVAALVMHFLHLIEVEVLTMITLVLLALLFIRGLRGERAREESVEQLRRLESTLDQMRRSIVPPDTLLVGPAALRDVTERFARQATGEMIWFHVCLSMFRPQPLFDVLLKPAIENDEVRAIRFTLDERQREQWSADVQPKIERCRGAHKVAEPCWTQIEDNVSFISAATAGGSAECLLSFWGEPFMSSDVDRSVPRFIFHVQPGSQLIERLAELERDSRLRARPPSPAQSA